MNSPSYCLQKMLWQYTYEIYINTLIAIIYFLSKHHLQGGDREQHSKTIALVISIHTTRKVVTATCRDCGIVTPDFNPHHPQGGDMSSGMGLWQSANFNPHHPQGGDYERQQAEKEFKISIHTTRKVVTRFSFPDSYSLLFQSTPPARWWPCTVIPDLSIRNFNPHHPQGGDRSTHSKGYVYRYFNPHHPQGGDSASSIVIFFPSISIHTTRKVVTTMTSGDTRPMQISIHTTRKVVTNDILVGRYMSKISIHTTRKVVTQFALKGIITKKFQSTPPARWWHYCRIL